MYFAYYKQTVSQVELAAGTLTVDGLRVGFNYPKEWAGLFIPAVDEYGKITSGKLKDAPYRRFSIGGDSKEQRKLFENYPYSSPYYYMIYREPSAAIGSLQIYPAQFSDDPGIEVDPGLTKAEKETAVKRLLDIFHQRGLGTINLYKQEFIDDEIWPDDLVGGWWGGFMSI